MTEAKVKAPKKRKIISYEVKKKRYGYLFILPWILGTISFFFIPLVQSFLFSISEIIYKTEGGYQLVFKTGFANYFHAFAEDYYPPIFLTESFTALVRDVPVIILLSLFLAVLLNQKFLGRTFVRGIFFLPVIIANGLIISILNGDVLSQSIMASQSSSQIFEAEFLKQLLMDSGWDSQLISTITGVVDSIFNLIWKSGIQILIFIAGLQSVPEAMYEAARIEGATGWESFWKITLPMISPMIILNLIYTIIDGFMDYTQRMMGYIASMQQNLKLEYAASLSWIYFIMVFVVVIIVYLIVNKFVFYQS